jgi:hypothetical protein
MSKHALKHARCQASQFFSCLLPTAEALTGASWHDRSSSSSSLHGRQLLQDCSVCPKDKNPVCAVDGKTFDNWCLAECGGKEVDYVGACGTAGANNQVPGAQHAPT